MFRIDDPSAVASRPAPTALATEGWFLRGIAGGAQGTVVTAEHKNMVQAEMEAIRALNPTDPGSDKTDDEQLAAAILARIRVPLTARGLTLSSNSGTNKITMASGRAWDSEEAVPFALPAARIKNLDAVFAVGNDVGGRAATIISVANDANYFVHSLHKPDGTTEMGFDDSPIAANLLAGGSVATLAGFTTYRHEGYAQTDGSGNVRLFYISPHKPDYVEFARPVLSFIKNSPIDVANNPYTFDLTPGVPINTRARFNFKTTYENLGSADEILAVGFHPKDGFPFPSAPPVTFVTINTHYNNDDQKEWPGEIDVDSNGEIYGTYFSTSAPSDHLEVDTAFYVHGFYFQRGL